MTYLAHISSPDPILRACKHTGEKLQPVSAANSFWRAFHTSPANLLKCWRCRNPQPQARPGTEAFEIQFSSSVSRWSLLPGRTGTPCGDSAGHPHLGLVGFSVGSTINCKLLVATARILECPIMTEDGKIASYPHVHLA